RRMKFALFAITLIGIPALATPTYTAVALPLGAFNTGVYGNALSSNGYVAGDSFLWQGGPLIPIPSFTGVNASPAFGVNSSGQVVGWTTTSEPAEHAYLYSGGVLTDLAPQIGGIGSNASAINDSGVIVGNVFPSANHSHGFSLAGGVLTDLGTLGGLNS